MTAPSYQRGQGHTPDDADAPGYRVTSDGRVFSIEHNWRGYGEREMGQTPNSDGYPSVRLTINGRRVRLAVHKLVARKYLPARPGPEYDVRHLDGDKTNPNSRNLAWGTAKDNADDRERHGRTSRGDRHADAIRAGLRKATTTNAREGAHA